VKRRWFLWQGYSLTSLRGPTFIKLAIISKNNQWLRGYGVESTVAGSPGSVAYQMTVSDLQRLVDTIANLARSGLPGTVSQLPMATSASNCQGRVCNNIRDLVTRVKGDGLS